jgi:hypothetical protein
MIRAAAITIRRRWLAACCTAMLAANALLATALLADWIRA